MSEDSLKEVIPAAILRSLQRQGMSRRRIVEMGVSFTVLATDVIEAISRQSRFQPKPPYAYDDIQWFLTNGTPSEVQLAKQVAELEDQVMNLAYELNDVEMKYN